MSGCCLPDPGDRRQAGFTLMELLIVLAILAVAAGLAVPRLAEFGNRIRWSSQHADVMRQLAAIGSVARLRGQVLQLDSADGGDRPDLVRLPEGWSLRADPPILYRHDGACSGGVIELTAGHVTETYRLAPPRCRPERR